jgi:hypothetical protein
MDKNLYKKALDNGCSPALAEMLACRQAPGSKTESMTGVASGNPFPDMPESLRQKYIREARAMGIEPNGKRYMASLVREGYSTKFDPQALVDNYADAKNVCAKHGWKVEGKVNYTPPVVSVEEKPYEIAPDILAREVNAVEGFKELKPKEKADVVEKTRERLNGAMR